MSVKLYNQHHYTMKPTRLTLFFRTCFLWQIIRFVVVNLRMTMMILKSHDSSIRRLPETQPEPVK